MLKTEIQVICGTHRVPLQHKVTGEFCSTALRASSVSSA